MLAVCRRLNGCEPVTLCPPPLLCSCNNTTAFVPTITNSQPLHNSSLHASRARRARQRLASASTNRVRRSPPERRSPLMLEIKPLFTRMLTPKDHVASAVPKHVTVEFGVCSNIKERRDTSPVQLCACQSIRQPLLTLSSHRRGATLANFRMHA